MNAVAWCVEKPGGAKDIYAFYHGVALWVADIPNTEDKVWQYAPGLDEAIEYLVERTAIAERNGWRLKEDPVEFDLSLEARATIWARDVGEWNYAPRLREELRTAVGAQRWDSINTILSYGAITHRPSRPEVGTIWYNTSTLTAHVWTGTAWTGLE